MEKTHSAWFYKLLLIIATILWGLSFVVVKEAMDSVPPAWLMGMRFIGTALILVVVFRKKFFRNIDKSHLLAGALLGVASFLGFWIQAVGLTDTTPGKNAFLTATYCVMVPFLYWIIAHRKPTVYNMVAAVLCIAGVGLVALKGDGFTMQWGDAMTLLSAVFFAIHIVLVAVLASRHEIMTITIVQIGVSGVLGIIVGLLTEPIPQASAFTLDFFMQLAYVIVFASCLAMVFQNIGQAHVPPAQASLLLSLESVFGVLFSVILFGEEVTVQLLLGFAMIFGAIVISEVFPLPSKKNAAPEDGVEGAEGSTAGEN